MPESFQPGDGHVQAIKETRGKDRLTLMPRIFDNIEQQLLTALRETLKASNRADFCVGYFNLRGWKQIDAYIEKWPGGTDNCCRLLVGMQRLPQEELISALSLVKSDKGIDQQTALRIKKKLAEEFREQLTTYGIPTNEDEAGLCRLAAQIKAKKVVVKLFLRHQLHAKLYLLFRPDPITPTVGYIGRYGHASVRTTELYAKIQVVDAFREVQERKNKVVELKNATKQPPQG